jgi:hypothetical protein
VCRRDDLRGRSRSAAGRRSPAVAEQSGVRLTIDVGRSKSASAGSSDVTGSAVPVALLAAEMTFTSRDDQIIGKRVFDPPDSSCSALVEALSMAAALFFEASRLNASTQERLDSPRPGIEPPAALVSPRPPSVAPPTEVQPHRSSSSPSPPRIRLPAKRGGRGGRIEATKVDVR